MLNPYPSTNFNDDPYAISQEDAARIKEENERKTSSRAKVKWLSLPPGEGMSNWRILPFIKRRSFYTKVSKHFNVPGLRGSITCPRSFEDPNNPGRKYNCAICEKFFDLLKSKEPGDVAFAKLALKQSTSYYANAVNLDKPEEGVGVLNMPYAVWNTLYEWLDIPEFREFSHPKRGRNFKIKAKTVAGSQIPGKPNQEKRDYLVIPDMTVTQIGDDTWLENLYDLEAILGVPTYEFTKSCLEKLLTDDATAGQLPEGTPLYVGQLAAAPADAVAAETGTYSHSQVSSFIPPSQSRETHESPETEAPLFEKQTAPKFAEAQVKSNISDGKLAPTTQLGSDDHRLCFGLSFDEDNKTCLKCPENEACELKVLKAARNAGNLKKAEVQSTSTTPSAFPGTAQSEDEIRNLMMKALAGKK